MFTATYRDQVSEYVLQLAAADKRVVAAAVVGSMANSGGDRWSDLDLTYAVADEHPIQDVLEEWTENLTNTFEAAHLFDVTSGTSLYRVFLLPECLQLDISFTPASSFGPAGPQFRLLFGEAVTKPHATQPAVKDLFGYAVHHALRARICIERGRYWQAEYWISAARDYALNLACRRQALPAHHGRGFDDLPQKVQNDFRDSFVTSLDPAELRRALDCVVKGLLTDTVEVQDLASKVEPQLQHLSATWDS